MPYPGIGHVLLVGSGYEWVPVKCGNRAKVILGHMGEFLPFQLSRLDPRYQTLKEQKLRRMPSAYFGHNIFITTSGVFSPESLAGAVMAIGEDAILFAIDYPTSRAEMVCNVSKAHR
jgi:2,3-dihydroxybenzoate decarboxylase